MCPRLEATGGSRRCSRADQQVLASSGDRRADVGHLGTERLVAAACAAGVVGGFPTANARSGAELDEWLDCIEDAAVDGGTPYAANLIVRSPRFAEDLDVLVRHRAPW